MNNTLNRPLFRNMGGPAAMMPQDMMAPPQMAPNNPEDQLMQAEQSAEVEGRAYVEKVMGGIDAAEDVTSMINALRGNEAPLESRYAELAGYVGEADAGQTPESVLAMVQPTLMMTEEGAIDSGIGELMVGMAESEMETPQGEPTAMGQGVGELMTMGAGSTPPVNFRQGGEVQYFAPGGSVISNAQAMAPEYQKYFAGAMDSEARAADLEEQKRLSQAQVFFDIAQTALAAGAPTATPMSAAERIAGAVGQTQLFDKMGQRSAGLLAAKQAQAAEDRQMRMAGLQGALGQSQADESARRALELARAKKKDGDAKYQRLVGPDGKPLGTFNIGTAEGVTNLDAAIAANPDANLYNLGTEPSDSGKSDLKIVVSKNGREKTFDLNTAAGKSGFETASAQDGAKVYTVSTAPSDPGYKTITVYDPANPTVAITKPTNTVEEREVVSDLLAKDYTTDDKRAAAAISEEFTINKEERGVEIKKAEEQRAIDRETVVYGRDRTDELADIDAAVARKIAEEERTKDTTLSKEERDQITWEARNTITTQNDLDRLAVAQGLRDESQMNAEDRAAIVAQNNFVRDRSAQIEKEIRAIADRNTIELREVNGELVRVDTLTGDTTVLFGEPKVPDPSMAQVTLRNADGVPVTTVIDITSPQGKAMLEKVNAANAAAPSSASYQKVPTASTTVQGYLIYNEDKTVKGVYTSYDGKTYIDDDGNAQIITGGSHPVNDTIAYDVAKNEKLVSGAQAQLDAMDTSLVLQMTGFDSEGNARKLTRTEMSDVKDAYAAARKGTGFWSKVYAGLDAVAGGLAPVAFGDLFKDTTDARQFIKMVRVMGRSALASSPKYAVGDLVTVEQVFPNEQTFLANPKTEARKLNDVVGYLTEEKVRILELFASGSPMDSTMKSTLNQKLFEINRLERILGPVTMLGEASENASNFGAALETMKAARQRAKDAEKN